MFAVRELGRSAKELFGIMEVFSDYAGGYMNVHFY